MREWIPVIVSVVAASGAITAAVASSRAAARSSRIMELERRLSESRAQVFEPMVEALLRIWDLTASGRSGDEKAYEEAAGQDLRRFVHWVQIYGSDDSVMVAHRFMQALYHDPPPNVVMRLIGELVLVARRELGYADTEITPIELLGMRITDVYTDANIRADLTLPLDEVFTRHSWTPPWSAAA